MIDVRDPVNLFEDFVNKVKLIYDTENQLQPFFDYGHPLEVARKLDLMSGSNEFKSQKFPMVLLVLDTKLSEGKSLELEYSISPQVLILANTESIYLTEDRRTNVFIPILYPIYRALIEVMDNSSLIKHDPAKGTVERERIDRYFWGKEGIKIRGNESLIFNEYLDGIELNFNDLGVYKYIDNC